MDMQRDRLQAVFFCSTICVKTIKSDMDIKMFQKLITVIAWVLLAFIAVATLSPIQDRPTLPTSSNFEHVAAFAVLGILFCLAYPRHTILAAIIVLGSAALLESLQLLTPDRHGRLLDVVGKMAGGGLGIAAGRVMLPFKQPSRWFQN
jgi:VanZ family protein